MNTASIGVGSVRHTRARPAKHQLSAPVFFLRLPLRSLDTQAWPYRWLARNGRGVFALNDADHGDGRPLLTWADALLRDAGIDDADGELWLHTFPRLFGYLFNPVSFWFAHRADGALRAVICEVNNTFGDRHCYVLAHEDGRPLRWGEPLVATKRMYVSPFCEVRGGYQFRFLLAQARQASRCDRFVARIDYYDGAFGAPALITTSVEGALSPLTDRRLALTALSRPLFTLGVIARIHWHALRLWLKGVPFFRKPAAPDAYSVPAQAPVQPHEAA